MTCFSSSGVVDQGGFTAASRTLRVPKSTLSHRMQKLEADLEVRLLNRTSRHFGMTDAGSEFYHHAVAMLREAETGRGLDPAPADRAVQDSCDLPRAWRPCSSPLMNWCRPFVALPESGRCCPRDR